MLTTFDKAIVAFLMSGISVFAMTSYGHSLADPATQGAITSILTAVVVFLVPNKVP